jgi:hypothetical protein
VVIRLGQRKEREAQEERGLGFEDVVFHSERGDLIDILGTCPESAYWSRPMSGSRLPLRHPDVARGFSEVEEQLVRAH